MPFLEMFYNSSWWDYLNTDGKVGASACLFIFLSRPSTSTLPISRRGLILRRISESTEDAGVWVLDIITSIAASIIISIITSVKLPPALALVSPSFLFCFFPLNVF